MKLYEFTFIAQQWLLQQEVEDMVQELDALLKTIKVECISNLIKGPTPYAKSGGATVVRDDSLLDIDNQEIQENLLSYSSVLEKIIKALYTELSADLSNLQEVESYIKSEIRNISSQHESASSVEKVLKSYQVDDKKHNKSAIICDIIKIFKKGVNVYLGSEGVVGNPIISESIVNNAVVSGLIKYEYWGLLNFAYPINKAKSGHYCMLCINSTPEIMREFTRKIKLNTTVIRYLCVNVDKFMDGKSYMVEQYAEAQGT